MKRMLWLALIALALPMAAFANSGGVDFTNSGGTLTGSGAGMSLSGSVLIAVNGLNGSGLVTGNDLGSVSFSTSMLMSGSLQMGGTFMAGGTFIINGNGTNGVPNTVIFNGTFDGPVTWSSISGTWIGGSWVNGATVQLTINTGKGFFNGSTSIASGDTNIDAVPEPGSLTLVGAGLVGLAGMLRRKLKA